MPKRGNLGKSVLGGWISFQMNRIGECRGFWLSGCDEIINSGLMGIATGQSFVFVGLTGEVRRLVSGIIDLPTDVALMHFATANVKECNDKTPTPARIEPATLGRSGWGWQSGLRFRTPILFRRPSS